MISEETTTMLRYQGAINGPIISKVLDDLDLKCTRFNIPDSKRKKLFNIAVEMVQNLYHYTRDLKIEGHQTIEIRHIDLSLSLNEQYYILSTTNVIINKDIKALKSKIDFINSLEGDKLKAHYKEILSNEEFSEKGGAGLGFIDMKKRSGLALETDFETIDNDISFYTLTVKIIK